MTRHMLRALALLATFTLAVVPTTQAGLAPRHHGPGILQGATLQATKRVQTWESRPVAGAVYVSIRDTSGRRLRQVSRTRNGCAGTYADNDGLVARVILLRCRSKAANPIRISFASLNGSHKIHVSISRYELSKSR